MPPIDPTDLNKVKLLIGWYGWRNWQDIRISRSIEAAASDFVLSFTVHPKQTVRRFEIYPGDPCTVSIGPDLVITGHVDDVSQSLTRITAPSASPGAASPLTSSTARPPRCRAATSV